VHGAALLPLRAGANPRLYELMFQADLPLTLRDAPDQTPGRRSFDNSGGSPCDAGLDARLHPPTTIRFGWPH